MWSLLFSETTFTKPKPSIDNPRKILFSIDTDNLKEVNHIIGTINNVMKFYRPENTEIIVVTYSQGVKVLLKSFDKPTKVRIEALMTYDVEFIACQNTMRTLKIDKKELLDDISFVTAGIVEIIEKKLDGFSYIIL
jgi:intracellular sulfur oxidation DsrE/DsrF family protein